MSRFRLLPRLALAATLIAGATACGVSEETLAAAQDAETQLAQLDAVERVEVGAHCVPTKGCRHDATFRVDADASPEQIVTILDSVEQTYSDHGLDRSGQVTLYRSGEEHVTLTRRVRWRDDEDRPTDLLVTQLIQTTDHGLAERATSIEIGETGGVAIEAGPDVTLPEIGEFLLATPPYDDWEQVRISGVPGRIAPSGSGSISFAGRVSAEMLSLWEALWSVVAAHRVVNDAELRIQARDDVAPRVEVTFHDDLAIGSEEFLHADHADTHWPLMGDLLDVADHLVVRRADPNGGWGPPLFSANGDEVSDDRSARGWDEAARRHRAAG
jgi:hypothetical protein